MKKYIALLSLALVASAFSAEAITDQRTVLSRTTDEDGITTSIYIGRITSDPTPSGDYPVTVHLAVVKTTASGRIISNDAVSSANPITFTLPKQAAAGIAALVKAAYDSANAPAPSAP